MLSEPGVRGRPFALIGAVYGLVGVVFGAFGAHGLRNVLDANGLRAWETAVDYQLLHAVVLLVIGFFLRSGDTAALRSAGYAIALGVLLFSGSIYVLAFDGPRGLGPVTPVGGTCLIAGWAGLVYAAVRAR